ncbi:GTPase RsgA, partial [Pseudomonas syringae]|uniref:GTPase RsgA n=1 Tax=Pseudomonas syringae TaxID=317 RepID=UPI001F50A382
MAKRQLNRRQNWRIEKIQGERAARAAKRESATLETLEGGDLGPEQTGLVIAHFGVQVEVEAQEGEVTGQVFRCHLRANLPALVTGDRVVWRAGNQGIGVIVAQLPRTTELRRPDSRGQLKPVAANVDLIVIVFAPMPEPHANLIDRYLVAAEHAGIRPLLLLNKADLIDEQKVWRRSVPTLPRICRLRATASTPAAVACRSAGCWALVPRPRCIPTLASPTI